MNTVIAAVVVNPNSSQRESKFFFKELSTLNVIDVCAIFNSIICAKTAKYNYNANT